MSKEKEIRCKKCGTLLAVEISGTEKYYDRPGRYHYCNTFKQKREKINECCIDKWGNL